MDVPGALRDIGWPLGPSPSGALVRTAVRDFQVGYDPGPGRPILAADGLAGPATQAALRACLDRGGRCSEFFAFREFASKGNGWIRTYWLLVRNLDHYRREVGRPVSIVSGYRDPAHNRRVGGATRSQHMAATAADLVPVLSLERVWSWGLFTGIGYQAATRKVRHVDMRPGNPARPTIWRYGR